MKNIRGFYLKFFSFLEVKFSTYLHRRVFVMSSDCLVDFASFYIYSYRIITLIVITSRFDVRRVNMVNLRNIQCNI